MESTAGKLTAGAVATILVIIGYQLGPMQSAIESNKNAIATLTAEIAAVERRDRDRLVTNRDHLQREIRLLHDRIADHTPQLAEHSNDLEWLKLHLEEIEEACKAP